MANEKQILKAHDEHIDSIVSAFTDRLAQIIPNAEDRLLKALQKGLDLERDGTIARSRANMRVLRKIDKLFSVAMTNAGYDSLVKSYTGSFADHLPDFHDVVKRVSAALDTPLPDVQFTQADVDIFASSALNARDQLVDVVDTAAIAAKRQALFSVGGMKFADLVSTMRDQFETTQSQAVTLADTTVNIFYRTVTEQAFQKIEDDLPSQVLKYNYVGPDDKKTRVFCEDTLAKSAKGGLTRDEIDQLDNGQMPNVFLTGGGFNCRHTWIIDTTELTARAGVR